MTRPIILDGGMSRELVRRGATLRQPEWSALALINEPAVVRQVHEDFIAAGAEVITTNSYAVVPFHIGEERFRAEGLSLARRAGELAREAVHSSRQGQGQSRVRVAGSLPPVFGSYEPELFDPARVQDYLSVLVEGLAPSVDLWLGETLSLIAEGESVAAAVAGTGKPFWISFTLADGPDDGAPPRLRSGKTVEQAARWAAQAGVAALLFNCSRPEVMAGAIRVAAKTFAELGRELPIGVYANAFVPAPEPESASAGLSAVREDVTGERYADFACDWVKAGASMVGGCCGIGAAHIACLARTLERRG